MEYMRLTGWMEGRVGEDGMGGSIDPPEKMLRFSN